MLKPEIVDRALAAIKGYAQYEYFFERLNSPAWLTPLSERGMFRNPQPVEKVDPYIRFPFWPESRYLARMSKVPEAQAAVATITLAIPATENSRVYDDIADIALALPPEFAATLAPKLVEGVRLPIKLLLKDKVGDVIAYLAQSGQRAAAKTLTQAALALTADPSAKKHEGEELYFPKPQPLFEDFYYARIVAKSLPSLVSAVGIEAVELYANLLDDAISLSRKADEAPGNDEDYLYIAHSAIEQGGGQDDVPGILLFAIRDAAEQVIRYDAAQLSRVLDVLGSKRWTSFVRLKLHLCRLFLTSGGQATAERIFQSPDILNRGSLQHEAVLLLKSSFAGFSAESKERLLTWIDRGWPDEASKRWLELTGQPATEENIRGLGDIWKRDHLAVLRGQLPEPYQGKLDELVARRGPAHTLDEPKGISGGAFGAVSPKAPQELGTMSAPEIIEFLATWTPGTDMFEATAEGAARDLGGAVSAEPDRFIAAAGEFKRLDPTYVRAFLSALAAAVKENRLFDWMPVLDLAAWVVSQPREIPERKGGLLVADPDWGWSRDAIIDLLSAGFDQKLKGRFTLELRDRVWSALRPLTNDPHPSPADEVRDPKQSESPVVRRFAASDERAREMDFATFSINTTRGRAMHAVFSYARWVRLEMEAKGEKPAGLEVMPEVREVLEEHLDVNHEPAQTIRSVYGDHLTLLAWLDWNWLEANIDRILPMDEADYPYFKAAWRSFIVFNQPNTSLFRVLTERYRKAVHHLGKDVLPRHQVKSPEEALADHLMVFYWLAALEFGAADRLLDDFYAHASDEIRGHAMWFIGISVAGWDDKAPPEIFVRLQDLFRRRLEAATSAASAEAFESELSNFGFWFTSQKFDERWSMDTLLAVLRLCKKATSEMDVMKRLAEVCPSYPVECVASLRLIIEGDKEGWILIGVEGDARALLKEALRSNVPEASFAATRLIEELIAKGQFGFRTLLDEKTP
jgi:hypothetical protein